MVKTLKEPADAGVTTAAQALQEIQAKRATEAASARAAARDLAQRMAAGEVVRGEVIAAALTAADMTAEAFDVLLGKMREHRALVAVAAGTDQARERIEELRRERDELDAAFRPIELEHRTARGEVLRQLAEAEADLANRQSAGARAARLAEQIGDARTPAERERDRRIAEVEREHAAEQRTADEARAAAEAALAEHRRRFPRDEHRPDDPIAIATGSFVHIADGEIGAGDSAADVFRLFVRAEAARRIAAAFGEVAAAVRAGRDHVPAWRRAVTMRSRTLGAGPIFE